MIARRALLLSAAMPMLAGAADENSAPVIEWLRTRAIPLKVTEPDQPSEDLAPLKALVGSASLVVLGEATHGTREFFRLKHRLIAYLVAQLGFTHVALEASVADAARLNQYVQRGEGDPASLLRNLGFWAWDTEELLAFFRWLRHYNESATKPVQFAGIDVQHPETALHNVRRALSQPEFNPAAADWPAVLSKLSAESAEVIQSARQVRQNRQAAAKKVSRDRSMADNVQWLLDHSPNARVVVWTHNGHAALTNIRGFDPMGVYLRQMYGRRVILIGSAFYEGEFRTMTPKGMRFFKVLPTPAGSLDATFAAAGLPAFLIDLRSAPSSGPVHDWLHAPHPVRMAGGSYSEDAPLNSYTPADTFDAMLFVRTSTPAQPLP